MKHSHTGILRLIAVFKLLKAAALVAIGVGAFKLIHANIGAVVEHWIAMLNLDPGSRLVDHGLEKIAQLSPHKIRLLGIGSFIYAGLFLTEGTGLWLLKRWGEWVTVIITSSLVPVEIYEIFHRPTAIKILVLLVNLAVVAYLIYHIKHAAPPAASSR